MTKLKIKLLKRMILIELITKISKNNNLIKKINSQLLNFENQMTTKY